MIEKQIESLFRKEYDSGMTQQELAKKHNVGQQVISRLLSGQRKWGGISVATLDKMFPQAVLYFEGAKVSINNRNSRDNSGGNFVQGDFVTNNASECDQKSIRRVLDSDLPDPDKLRVIQILVPNN